MLERVWGGDETVVVVSSDLSHYLDDASARERDQRTALAITRGPVRRRWPLRRLWLCADLRACSWSPATTGSWPRMLAASTSADTSGDVDRVVGYGSFGFGPRGRSTTANGAG